MSGLRWGILSTGHIARQFTGDLLLAGLEVTAVGSQDQGRADAFAAEFGIPNSHGSYEALAADPDVDVVYIATPHPFHARNALLCLRGGKHVLVEKPLAMSQVQGAEVADLAADLGLLAQEALWSRFLPHMRRVRELLDAGALGEVERLTADHSQRLPADPTHRMRDPALGGGALLDLGIYPVSYAWELFGQPVEIQAVSDATPEGVDRQTSIVLRYPDGAQAALTCQLDARGSNRATIVGTEARIEFDPIWFTPTSFRVIDPDDRVVEEYVTALDGHGMQFEAFAVEEAVAAGRLSTPELPIQESVRILGVMDEIRARIGLRYPGEA